MMLTGDGGELEARRVVYSRGRALAPEPCGRASVARKQAVACPWGGAPRDQVACIEVGGTAEKADVDARRAA
jgi:hypothetical protein